MWCRLLSLFKEKSWSVKLVNGYASNSQVRADRCKGCESTTKFVVGNNNDEDLVLYGCNGHKCKHILIRMNFSELSSAMETLGPSVETLQISTSIQ